MNRDRRHQTETCVKPAQRTLANLAFHVLLLLGPLLVTGCTCTGGASCDATDIASFFTDFAQSALAALLT